MNAASPYNTNEHPFSTISPTCNRNSSFKRSSLESKFTSASSCNKNLMKLFRMPRRDSSPSYYTRKIQKSKTLYLKKSHFPFTTTSIIRSSVKTFQNPEHRDYMEDITVIKHCFLKNPSTHLFCVFDGHGGDECAKLSEVFFPDIFAHMLKEEPNKIAKCLYKSFIKLDQEAQKENCISVGNTATVVYIHKKQLYCANVGDSSCCLVSTNQAKIISYDDKCNDLKEVKRIKLLGGQIIDNRLEGVLAMTRAIGDFDLKDCGLIAKPHIYQCEITKNDRFCVIASDGIWDVVNSDDVYNICEREYNCDVIVEKIVNLAIENGSQDNISCIVVALNSYN